MNPIDYIKLVRKHYPPDGINFEPDQTTLIAIDHVLMNKYKLTINERAFIFVKAYYPESFSTTKVTGLSLKRYAIHLTEEYQSILNQVNQTL